MGHADRDRRARRASRPRAGAGRGARALSPAHDARRSQGRDRGFRHAARRRRSRWRRRRARRSLKKARAAPRASPPARAAAAPAPAPSVDTRARPRPPGRCGRTSGGIARQLRPLGPRHAKRQPLEDLRACPDLQRQPAAQTIATRAPSRSCQRASEGLSARARARGRAACRRRPGTLRASVSAAPDRDGAEHQRADDRVERAVFERKLFGARLRRHRSSADCRAARRRRRADHPRLRLAEHQPTGSPAR